MFSKPHKLQSSKTSITQVSLSQFSPYTDKCMFKLCQQPIESCLEFVPDEFCNYLALVHVDAGCLRICHQVRLWIKNETRWHLADLGKNTFCKVVSALNLRFRQSCSWNWKHPPIQIDNVFELFESCTTHSWNRNSGGMSNSHHERLVLHWEVVVSQHELSIFIRILAWESNGLEDRWVLGKVLEAWRPLSVGHSPWSLKTVDCWA